MIIGAERAKYVSNAMLAARISFMNELSHLCGKTSRDIEKIKRAVSCAPGFGADFLNAGIGYDSSCLPKDIMVLINFFETIGCEMARARAIQKVSIDQLNRFVQLISDYFDDHQAKLAICVLAFKVGTDDTRNSAALYCIDALPKRGFEIGVYGHLVSDDMNKICNGRISIPDNRYSILNEADALVIFTDEAEFKKADLQWVSIKVKVIFDGERLFNSADLKRFGVEYHCISRKFCEIGKKVVTFPLILHL